MSPLTFYVTHTDFSPYPSWVLPEYEDSCSVWGKRQMKTWADSYFKLNCIERISQPSCQGCLIEVETIFVGLLDGYTQVPLSQSTTNEMRLFFHFIFPVRRSACFRRVFCPSWGAQNCTYSVRHLSGQYCYLLLAAGSSDGRTNTWRCLCSFELLMMDGKTVWNI